MSRSVWFGDGRFLLWSDIPNNRIMEWDEETGLVSVFRQPSNNSNGNARDRQGRLITCGWSGGEGLDGVAVFNPDGKLIGRIELPDRCANLCFGGRHRNRLFMCASTSVFSLFVNTQGAV